MHRHPHEKRDSVYAYPAELDTWWASQQARLEQAKKTEVNVPGEVPVPGRIERHKLPWLLSGTALLTLLALAGSWQYWGAHRLPSPALSFAPRDWVLITDFDNRTGEPIFDKSLSIAFTVSLEQSPHANVFPAARIRAALQRMGRSDETGIDEQVGREICLREHLQGLISCSITKTGRKYALAARLIDPQTGAAVQSYFEAATSQDEIIAVLGKITVRIRRDLGESLASIRRNDDPLPQVTTPSLDALRLFAEGNYLWRRGHYNTAVRAYQSALEHDPDFAMAHAALGGAYMSHIFSETLKGKQHYEKALKLEDRITDRERLSLQAFYQDSMGHVDEAVRNYRLYLNAYPDDTHVRFELGTCLMHNDRYEEAIEEFKSVLQADPTHARAWIDLATSCQSLNRLTEALADYAKAFELEPTWVTLGNLNHEYGFTLAASGNISKAREVFALGLAKPDMEDRALRSLALLDMYEGKYRDANPRLRRAILLCEGNEEALSRARDHLFLAMLLQGQGDSVSQLRELDSASDSLAKWPSPAVWLWARIGAAYAGAGAGAKADCILRKLGPQTDRENPSDIADVRILEGELALSRGDYSRAVEKLQLGAKAAPLPLGLAGLARAYQKAGATDQAIECYEELISLRKRALGWEPQQAWLAAHADLAEAYLSQGERTKAAQALDELARLWKLADPGLSLVKRIGNLRKRIQGRER